MDTPSAMAMTFSFANSATGNCVWGFLGNPVLDEARDTRLYGSQGALISSRGQVRLVHPDGSNEDYRVEPFDTGHYNMWLNFHEGLIHDAPIVATIQQSFENMLVVLQALESAERGERVDVMPAGAASRTGGIPLWRPRGATELFEGLACTVRRIPSTAG
jgi:hypothetical protein